MPVENRCDPTPLQPSGLRGSLFETAVTCVEKGDHVWRLPKPALPTTRAGAEPGNQLVGRVRDRPRRHDPGHRHRAGDGHALGAASMPLMSDHDHRLPPVPAAGRAVGDDARPHRRLADLRVRRLQGRGRGSPSTSTAFTGWAYWLGWFPVAPLNMILASFYIVDRFDLGAERGSRRSRRRSRTGRWSSRSSASSLVFIPAFLGIRLGAVFATVLGLLSMIPLTFLAIAPIFRPSVGRLGPALRASTSSTARASSPASRPRLADRLPRLRVPADLERDRDGGGGLLHRRVQGPRARRQDRDEPGGPVRALHLHDDPDRVHRRARRASALSNPALVDPDTIFSTFAGTVFSARAAIRSTG